MRFKLEDAGSQSFVEYPFVGFRVLERNLFQCYGTPLRLEDQLQRIRKNGERGQPQEIHLQQAHLLDGDHVEGSDNFVVLGAVQGDEVGERARSNDHSGRMHAGITHHSLEFSRSLDQLTNLSIFSIASRSCGESSMACSRVMLSCVGTILAMRSTSL